MLYFEVSSERSKSYFFTVPSNLNINKCHENKKHLPLFKCRQYKASKIKKNRFSGIR